ncbi:lysylphosphatidylglycerol synthase domain-containing protein [Streptomyces sp. NPDC007808]|uniref:lysylphosphatidylglycerol synthase domain-containing protein n=1 Tax=Streptomyces sp. NPDC007808 TaxID=3364779 RepID=UPI0036BEBCC4
MTPEQILPPAQRRQIHWHIALTLAVLAAVAWLARRHWPVLETGAARLAVADQGWLLAAAAATVATWPCSAFAQQGAVLGRLPPGRLLAAQFAASAANHVLPVGLGAGVVNLRFLTRCGIPFAGAAAAIAVKGTAGAVARGALIAVLVAACPGVLSVPTVDAGHLVALCLTVLAVLALLAAPAAARCRRALTLLRAHLGAIHARPARTAALWGGSLAFATLHCVALGAVTRAVGLPLPPAQVALLHLVAGAAAALLPTPGGLGSLDAALALALAAAGAPAVEAASAVLGYRLLTVWLPLVPGLVVLGVLVRRGAL